MEQPVTSQTFLLIIIKTFLYQILHIFVTPVICFTVQQSAVMLYLFVNHSKTQFSYADFIRANTTGKNADIFRCIESNQLCFPGENELYAYTGEYLSTFHVQIAQEEQPDDECEMEIG